MFIKLNNVFQFKKNISLLLKGNITNCNLSTNISSNTNKNNQGSVIKTVIKKNPSRKQAMGRPCQGGKIAVDSDVKA